MTFGSKIKTLLTKTRDKIKLRGSIANEINTRGDFIKKFRADHDSQEFYKNVIKWYIETYKKFPDV